MTTEPQSVKAQLVTVLQQAPVRVLAAYLFGSHARADATKGSDVDVAVLLPEKERSALVGVLSRVSRRMIDTE
ncbi:MAG: hypothetical protein MAG794_00338 [Gammaproteobacteria bacterium]|nr:hypothetical protein [Gammaproteobacteria bacterium]